MPFKLGLPLILVLLVVFGTASVTLSNRNKSEIGQDKKQPDLNHFSQRDQEVPVLVTQLASENGFATIEISCLPARLNAQNQLEPIACTLGNKSTKNVTSASLTYSILFDENSDSAKDTRTLTMESLIHPDFRKSYKPIAPGMDFTIRSSKSDFGYRRPKKIEVFVDYVQFEDGTIIGPDTVGSKAISDMREGAAAYKNWLVKEYINNGRSPAGIVSRLERDDQPSMAELGIFNANSNQELGARGYRTAARKLVAAKGPAEIGKFLPEH